jgi:hypothetical protein
MKATIATRRSATEACFRLRRIATVFLAGTAVAWFAGCGERRSETSVAAPQPGSAQQVSKAPSPVPGLPAKPQESATSTTTSSAESVFTAWQEGDKPTAVSRFVQFDWTARPLFATGSVLGLSETQFRANPQANQQELMTKVPILKGIAAAVAAAGRDAAAKKDIAGAKKYFTSLQQCGEALSGPDFTLLVQQIGKFVKGTGDEELAKLGQ